MFELCVFLIFGIFVGIAVAIKIDTAKKEREIANLQRDIRAKLGISEVEMMALLQAAQALHKVTAQLSEADARELRRWLKDRQQYWQAGIDPDTMLPIKKEL